MVSPIIQFRANISRARELGGVYLALINITTTALDVSDLLRSQIVMSVSALDHYIHEKTLHGMLEVLKGTRPPTDAYQRYPVSNSTILKFYAGSNFEQAFEEEIRRKHSYLSFQSPEKIADAVRLFSHCKLWEELATHFSTRPEKLKEQLRLIIERRNKIAHEADLDPSFPGSRWTIRDCDVEESTNFINDLCEAIEIIS